LPLEGILTMKASSDRRELSKTVARQVDLARATGTLPYASDLYLPGMLVAHVVRSPFAHCRIHQIGTSAAKEIPGVHAVLTHHDIPGKKHVGKTREDQPILAIDLCRSVQDALCLIAADDKQSALQAADALVLDLEPLPAVFDPAAALEPGAPQLWPEGNLLKIVNVVHGDVEQGFAEADVIVENEYETPFIDHAYMETESVVATPDPDGGVTVRLGCHHPYGERQHLAQALALPEELVRVIEMPQGGAFGGKDDNLVSIMTALLARATGRPVRLFYSRIDSLEGHSKRHPQRIHVRTGARRDGRLTACQVDLLVDVGAYTSWSEGVITFVSINACGPYEVPHARVTSRLVFTNNIAAGAMRGWGMPGITFATESQMDALAAALDMHPLRLRWLNALREGSQLITGSTVPAGVRFRDTLAMAASALGVVLEEAGR
jgi:CO/xanthine dehydrogenase Mo-binding subunit